MTEYTVRIGKSRRKNPPKSYNELVSLPYRSTDDDGLQVECGTQPWPDNVTCPDCKKAAVIWAEACYVPGHRICPSCGSHWRLISPSERDDDGREWLLQRARFYGG